MIQAKEIANDLTDLFKRIIKDKKLIETGRLYNSIKFTAVENSSGINFQLSAVDYFKFIDEKYGVTKSALNSREYQNIQNKIAEYYTAIITKELEV